VHAFFQKLLQKHHSTTGLKKFPNPQPKLPHRIGLLERLSL
jgi:hypothetical protein